ncbi:hypothetical protein AVEN_151811-1 [Araneus ventricosus]|uniref:Uncharacterized protein n=1 Tax=Araneus ventricosus TaxID=182803 RepID=A0A4Y2LVJ2_ARAVE|nr:hypothetical protein AVEN_151811-1 [Araneus ventricosus]
MTIVEPFGKVAERFAIEQETTFSVSFLQAFITSLFQAFQKVVKSPPSADKIEPPFPPPKPYSYRGAQPSPLFSPPLQSCASTDGSNPFFYSPSSDVILVLSGMSIKKIN